MGRRVEPFASARPWRCCGPRSSPGGPRPLAAQRSAEEAHGGRAAGVCPSPGRFLLRCPGVAALGCPPAGPPSLRLAAPGLWSLPVRTASQLPSPGADLSSPPQPQGAWLGAGALRPQTPDPRDNASRWQCPTAQAPGSSGWSWLHLWVLEIRCGSRAPCLPGTPREAWFRRPLTRGRPSSLATQRAGLPRLGCHQSPAQPGGADSVRPGRWPDVAFHDNRRPGLAPAVPGQASWGLGPGEAGQGAWWHPHSLASQRVWGQSCRASRSPSGQAGCRHQRSLEPASWDRPLG